MPKKLNYPTERVTLSIDTRIMKRLRDLQERSKGYVVQARVFENGVRRELDDLEKLYPPEKR